MDGNYWTAGLINSASTPKTAGVVDANRLNLVDLSQYGTVDQTSLEILLGQQRLTAPGLSLLPYATNGTAHTTQMFDSSQNANFLAYNSVPMQSLIQGTFCEIPTTLSHQFATSAVLTSVAGAASNANSALYKPAASVINQPASVAQGAANNTSMSIKSSAGVGNKVFHLADLLDGSSFNAEQLMSTLMREPVQQTQQALNARQVHQANVQVQQSAARQQHQPLVQAHSAGTILAHQIPSSTGNRPAQQTVLQQVQQPGIAIQHQGLNSPSERRELRTQSVDAANLQHHLSSASAVSRQAHQLTVQAQPAVSSFPNQVLAHASAQGHPVFLHGTDSNASFAMEYNVNTEKRLVSNAMANILPEIRNTAVSKPAAVVASVSHSVNSAGQPVLSGHNQIRGLNLPSLLPIASIAQQQHAQQQQLQQQQMVANKLYPTNSITPIALVTSTAQAAMHVQPVASKSNLVSSQPTIDITTLLQQQNINRNVSQPQQLADKNWTFYTGADGSYYLAMDDSKSLLDSTRLLGGTGVGYVNLSDSAVNSSVAGIEPSVVYEAVSPAAGNAGADQVSYNFYDSLQLGNLLGSTIDTSVLYTPQGLAADCAKDSLASLADSRQLLTSTDAVNHPVRDVLAEAVSQTFNLDRAPEELETTTRSKQPALGVVLPMLQARDGPGASAATAKVSKIGIEPVTQSTPLAQTYDYQSSAAYTPADQLSHEKQLSVSSSDTHGSAPSGGGGIMLSNITGNVYVNQYTMLPGGAQSVDNALLHDLALYPSAPGGIMAYDDAGVLEDGSSQAVQSEVASGEVPAFRLTANDTSEELGHLAFEPAADSPSLEKPASRSKNSGRSLSVQSSKSTDSSSFFPEEVSSLPVPTQSLNTTKASNPFESSFIKFLCGQKGETLSSVLNSPIRARPELPKYIPEPRRPRAASTDKDKASNSDVEIVEVSTPASRPVEKVQSNVVAKTEPGPDNKEISEGTKAAQTHSSSIHLPEAMVRLDMPKLPAKFSHKWNNRMTVMASNTPPLHQSQPQAIPDPSKDMAGSKLAGTAGPVDDHSNGNKTKNQSNQQWTVSKRAKMTSEPSTKSGLVLVLKAVPPCLSSTASEPSKARGRPPKSSSKHT